LEKEREGGDRDLLETMGEEEERESPYSGKGKGEKYGRPSLTTSGGGGRKEAFCEKKGGDFSGGKNPIKS